MEELMVTVCGGGRGWLFSGGTNWERTAPLCGDRGETGVGGRVGGF